MNIRASLFSVLFILCLFCASLSHADGPAVSGINAKVEGFVGVVDGEGSGGGAASLSIPLGNFIGFQIDGLVGEFDDQSVAAVGLHLFWRDPEVALLGAIYSYTDVDFGDFDRAGVEGEYYLKNLTFKAQLGWQGGHNIDDSAFGGGSLSYYFLENLVFQIGAQGGSGNFLGTVKAEWQPAFNMAPGLTAFANIGFGDDDYEHALFGLRYYFGSTKSLIKRHREDDPENTLGDGVGLVLPPPPPEPKKKKKDEPQEPPAEVCDSRPTPD